MARKVPMRIAQKVYETICDGCRGTQIEPTAIAGRGHGGWRVVNDQDLCSVCYGLMCSDLLEQTDTDKVDKIIRGLREKYPIDKAGEQRY